MGGQQQSPYLENLKKAEEQAQAAGLGLWTKVGSFLATRLASWAGLGAARGPRSRGQRGRGFCAGHACLHMTLTRTSPGLLDLQDPSALAGAVRNGPTADGEQVQLGSELVARCGWKGAAARLQHGQGDMGCAHTSTCMT